jgi:hypothetical protein
MEKAVDILLKMVLVKVVSSLRPRNVVVVELLVAARRGLEARHRSKKRKRMTSWTSELAISRLCSSSLTMHSPSPDEDSGDDEFGKDDDDLSGPSKPKESSVTRTRSGRVSRGVNRVVPPGGGSQAAARLLAAAAAVDAGEAAAQAIANTQADERPITTLEAPMEVEEKSVPDEMKVEEIEIPEDNPEHDGDTSSGAQRKGKYTAVRGRKSTRGRKGK